MRKLERSTIETWAAVILGIIAAAIPMTWWLELILLLVAAGLVVDIGLHAPWSTKWWHKAAVILGGVAILAGLGAPSTIQRFEADESANRPTVDPRSSRILVDGPGLGRWPGKNIYYLNVQITNKGPAFSSAPNIRANLAFSSKLLTEQQEDAYMAPLVGEIFTSPDSCNKSQMQVGQTTFHTLHWNIQPDVIDKLKHNHGYLYVFHVMTWCDSSLGESQRWVNEYCALLQDDKTVMYCKGHNLIYGINILPNTPK